MWKKLRKFRYGTNTPAAINLMQTAAENGTLGLSNDREHTPRIAVFITDGKPSLGYLNINQTKAYQMTKDAGKSLHDANIYDVIYAVGIQGKKGEIRDTLGFIADPPQHTFSIANFSEQLFNETTENITRQFCDREYIEYKLFVIKLHTYVTITEH